MEEQYTEAIKIYKIDLNTPKPDPTHLADYSFILIRHGLSHFNFKHLQASEEYGPESPEAKAIEDDPHGEDPELHPIGIL